MKTHINPTLQLFMIALAFITHDRAGAADMYVLASDADFENKNKVSFIESDKTDSTEVDTTMTYRTVDFGTLTAMVKGGMVFLAWKTLNEVNNALFTIERSYDINNWETVAVIQGAINSEYEQDYSHTDSNPLEGTSYYRIKQTDLDGNFTYSMISAVTVNPSDVEFHIYPQPANSHVEINLRAFSGNPVTLTLHTSSGKPVQEVTTDSFSYIMDISHLNQGIYFISVQSGNTYEMKKIIKN